LISPVNQGSIREVQFEKASGGEPSMTRMVIGLYMPVEYEVKAEGQKIRVRSLLINPSSARRLPERGKPLPLGRRGLRRRAALLSRILGAQNLFRPEATDLIR